MRENERNDAGDDLREKITDIIVESLATNEKKLPSEKEMMSDLGVSRTLLRETLSSFEASGLIRSQQGSGRYACLPDVSTQIVNLWSVVLRADPAFILDLLEVRSILELNSLQKAIEHINIDQLHALNCIVQEMERRAKKGKTFVAQDRQFHLTIYESLNNLPLQQLISAFWDLFQRANLGVHHEALLETVEQHREMLEALTKKDLEWLTRVTRQQLADARYRIILSLSERQSAAENGLEKDAQNASAPKLGELYN